MTRAAGKIAPTWIALPVLLALGFLVRVNGLGAQSLWNDEGTSVALSHLSLSAIASGAAHDIHPPLYYFLLHFWMSLAGDGEFAVRFLSVVAGLLLVAMTARLARDLFGPVVAYLAAGLSALSAFQLYYSQEARMYILVALWGAVSTWAMVRLLVLTPRPGRARSMGLWLLYIASTLAALYTHYYAPTIILAENLAFLAWLVLVWRAPRSAQWTQWRGILARWIGAQCVVALAFLPWLLYAGNQLASWPAISEWLSPIDLTTRVLSAFVLGIDTPLANQVWIVAVYGILFILGLLPLVGQATARPLRNALLSYWPILLAALWALIPLAFMYAVSLQRPSYNPKFLLLATPGFYLLAARGLSLLGPRGARSPVAITYARAGLLLVGCVVVVVGTGYAIEGVYSDPRLQRDDYRGVIGYINSTAQADDAVLVDAPGQMDVFRYYYHGAAPVFALPIGRPMQKSPTDDGLGDLLQHQNIFAVYWATEQADPEHYIESTLSTTRFQATDEWHGNIRLAQYGNGTGPKTTLTSAAVQFGGEIELEEATRFGPDPVPGHVLSLHFTWRALAHPSANLKVFVHLLDNQGHIVGQRDTEPVDGLRPTSSWNEGETVDDNLGLLIRPGTPPGDYTLEMGLYRPEDGVRLPLSTGGDHLILGAVRVAP